MARLLFVSKPVGPPWNDSGKNLVRDLACALTRHSARVMIRKGQRAPCEGLDSVALYPPAGSPFAPALGEQLRVFGHLLQERNHRLWHYFFAPNPRSCLAGRSLRALRGRPCVHTLCSAPRDPAALVPQLFADVHVVLSRHTEQRLLAAGLPAERVRRIAPAVAPLTPPDATQRRASRGELGLPEQAAVLLFPGDLEFGGGAALALEAFAQMAPREALLVMACRHKTPRARAVEAQLRARAAQLGLAARVRWLGETPAIHRLLGTADVVLLPSTDLYAKMDYPLVLLEAMALGRPVVVAAGSAAAELGEGGGAIACAAEAQALASQLEGLLDDPERARALGEAAMRSVAERFTPAAMARAYEALYDELLT